MNVERLTRLHALVSGISPAVLNMETWLGQGGCGTTACAVGWAAQDPWFKAQGLELVDAKWSGPRTFYRPVFGGKENMAAAALLFDLDPDITDTLFGDMAYDDSEEAEDIKSDLLTRITMVLVGKDILHLHYCNNNDEDDDDDLDEEI